MTANGAVAGMGRRSRAEADRLVREFEQSGLRRKEFCAARGLSGHTLDVWRRRVANSVFEDKIVPVEIIEDHRPSMGSKHAASVARGGQFRVVLADGVRIEVDAGFDAAELRRLIAALDSEPSRNGVLQAM